MYTYYICSGGNSLTNPVVSTLSGSPSPDGGNCTVSYIHNETLLSETVPILHSLCTIGGNIMCIWCIYALHCLLYTVMYTPPASWYIEQHL